MVVAKNRPAQAEPPPQPDIFVDTAFYIKLKATFEYIFFGVGCLHTTVPVKRVGRPHDQAQKRSKRQQVHRGNSQVRRQNVHGRQVNRQVHHTRSRSRNGKKTKQYEKKIKNWRKVERLEYQESQKKMERGAVDAPPIKRKYPRLRRLQSPKHTNNLRLHK